MGPPRLHAALGFVLAHAGGFPMRAFVVVAALLWRDPDEDRPIGRIGIFTCEFRRWRARAAGVCQFSKEEEDRKKRKEKKVGKEFWAWSTVPPTNLKAFPLCAKTVLSQTFPTFHLLVHSPNEDLVPEPFLWVSAGRGRQFSKEKEEQEEEEGKEGRERFLGLEHGAPN